MLIIKLTAAARKDLQESAKYYNLQQTGLGRKFKAQIQRTFLKISRAPKAASIAFDDVRYKVVEKFPYVVVYIFDDHTAIILRVFNTNLNPQSL